MADEVQVILELSSNAQKLLDRQGIDLLSELRRELPSLQVRYAVDSTAAPGSKDIVAIITATAGLVTSVAGLVAALRPIILRILDMISPPDQTTTWTLEERQDGTRIHRLHVFSSREQPSVQSQPEPSTRDKS